jgi:26S proteasome regulatory subunit N1
VQSPEDQQLKQELELLVERAKDPKPELQKAALESLKSHIRSSTTSMTSVPKPLKFLRPFYPELVTFYNDQMEYENKVFSRERSIALMTHNTSLLD